MSNALYANLRGKIVSAFGSSGAFAKAVGCSRQSVSNKLCGKTPFSKEDMIKWGDALGIHQKDYHQYFFI